MQQTGEVSSGNFLFSEFPARSAFAFDFTLHPGLRPGSPCTRTSVSELSLAPTPACRQEGLAAVFLCLRVATKFQPAAFAFVANLGIGDSAPLRRQRCLCASIEAAPQTPFAA